MHCLAWPIWLQVACVAAWVILGPSGARAQPVPVTDEDVELAIRRGVEFVWSSQGAAGGWSDTRFDRLFPGGLTALAAFTLRTAGAELGDPRLQRAVNRLLEDEDRIRTVYARAFRLMLWASLDPNKYRGKIRAVVGFLASMQSRQGVWGYGGRGDALTPQGWADNSNSQLAILALWEASQVGGEVNRIIWQRAEDAWLACQNDDGGWGYTPVDNVNDLRPDSYGSMTAAGLATLYILYDQLYARSQGRFDGVRAKNCRYDHPDTRDIRAAMDRAWNWMNTRFVPDRIPDFPTNRRNLHTEWLTYYLYSVERAGVASGFKTFGVNNWYRDLAEHLVRTQESDGSWGGVHQTCFGLLALVKGRTPIVINKLRHGTGDDWNNTPCDAATLTRWLSRRLETPVTWQIVDLRSPDADVKDAPILYLTGHLAPELSEFEGEVLRDYVLSGGTVVAVACCSRKAFTRGAQALFDRLFPRLHAAVLEADHPLWSIFYQLQPSDEIIGYSDGCRTRLFVVTRGVCCAWHQDLHDKYEDMFRLGANLLHYATNRTRPRSLARGLRTGRIAGIGRAPQPDDDSHSPPSGVRTITVGRVKHDGDYWIGPYALRVLSEELTRAFGLGLRETESVDPLYDDLSRFDLLWLTGTTLPLPDAGWLAALKTYLLNGGTLVASACCGRPAFDEAFVEMIERMYGREALIPIEADDPLVTGRLVSAPAAGWETVVADLGSRLDQPRLRRSRRSRFAPTTTPASHPVPTGHLRPDVPLLKGVRLPDSGPAGQRWAVIYSPLDIHLGCDGHFCVDCNGYQPRDARALAGNIVLYVYLQRHRPGPR